MSIQDNKYEIYISGYCCFDYMNKNYVNEVFKKENNFNITENISEADFIYLDPDYKNTSDFVRASEYAHINCIETAECLEDLLRLRDEYEFKKI